MIMFIGDGWWSRVNLLKINALLSGKIIEISFKYWLHQILTYFSHNMFNARSVELKGKDIPKYFYGNSKDLNLNDKYLIKVCPIVSKGSSVGFYLLVYEV